MANARLKTKKTSTKRNSKARAKIHLSTRLSKWWALVFALVFGAIGGAILYISHAATEPYTMYRLSSNGYSYYTISPTEKDFVISLGWKLTSTSPYTNAVASGPVNVYKLQLKANGNSWFFTTNAAERDKMIASGWTNKGIGFTAATSPSVPYGYCRQPWFRLQAKSTTAPRYIWTQSASEKVSLLSTGQWNDQGVGFNLDYSCPSNPAPSKSLTTTTTSTTNNDCDSTSLKKASGSFWICTFSDEFSGSSLDKTYWVPQLSATSGFATSDTKNGNARACFVDGAKNISVTGGYLNLSAQKLAAPISCRSSSGYFSTSYTAAQVMTYQKFSQKFGRFEVRAKLPSYREKGLQETFWLWPDNATKYGAWPASGEIDFGEFYSKYPDYNVPYIHYNYKGYDTQADKNIVTLLSPTYNKNYNGCAIKSGDFNTYTAVWQSGYIELDVNGKPCVVDNYTSTTGAVPAPFDQPFFMALTQAIGINENAFEVDKTPLPATTQIDYVRIWK